MSKSFNIHEWQAKILKEQDGGMYLDPNEFDRENLEFDIEKYIGLTFTSWMSPSNPPFAQAYAKPPYIDKLVKGIADIVVNRYKTRIDENLNPEVSKTVNRFIKGMAKRYDYSEQDAVLAIMTALKQRNMDEMSTTGGGASFNAGTGAGYMTPYAFKKKRKKD